MALMKRLAQRNQSVEVLEHYLELRADAGNEVIFSVEIAICRTWDTCSKLL
jgi:hypothetical protein